MCLAKGDTRPEHSRGAGCVIDGEILSDAATSERLARHSARPATEPRELGPDMAQGLEPTHGTAVGRDRRNSLLNTSIRPARRRKG